MHLHSFFSNKIVIRSAWHCTCILVLEEDISFRIHWAFGECSSSNRACESFICFCFLCWTFASVKNNTEDATKPIAPITAKMKDQPEKDLSQSNDLYNVLRKIYYQRSY